MHRRTPGEVPNIGAQEQISNLEPTRMILDILDAAELSVEYVDDRPGHDRRYAVDSSRIRALEWAPQHTRQEWLGETVDWYRRRRAWWAPRRGSAS
jgi:dTDP-glucose 4,6-dehydratase